MSPETPQDPEELVISHAYPRPQLERKEWTSLNGKWEFALDRDAAGAGRRSGFRPRDHGSVRA